MGDHPESGKSPTALRQAPDGLPDISTDTIGHTLHAAGFGWQKSRTWCETGVMVRKRKQGGLVSVTGPDAAVKRELIERAYTPGIRLGLAVWCADELARSRPCRTRAASSWRPHGRPATQPHEYVRSGTTKILTLFHPATGQVYRLPVTACTNPVRHGWLKTELTAILARLPIPSEPADVAVTQVVWQVLQDGLTAPFTLPEPLPPLRLLLVWDNLAGHKSTDMVLWLCQHGIMPLYTPLGGSWLNRAESSQRILRRRALAGQHPQAPTQIGTWFEQTAEAWTANPHPLSGTASAASDGASGAVTSIRSAAWQHIRCSRSQAARAAIMNGICQAKEPASTRGRSVLARTRFSAS